MTDERQIFPTLLGNGKIKKTISSDISLGKGAHAYILDGPRGSGKHTAARLICAAAACEHRADSSFSLPCGKCEACRKILSGVSVDVMTVSNDGKASIGVGPIRELRASLYITPNDGEKKFYIIENAHLMTVQAQNALLLSLEEPPPYVMFLLLCEDSSALLETIRSRAPIIKTERFSPDFTEKYLEKKYPSFPRERIVYSAHLADGSLGLAEELLINGEGEMKLCKNAAELARILLSPRRSDGAVFIPTLPKDRGDVCRILSLARLALRDAAASKKGGELLFYSASDGVPDYTKKISVKRITELSSALIQAENDISANCSVSTVLTSLILNSQKG